MPVAPKTTLLYAAIESAAPRAAGAGKPADHLRDDLVDGAFGALAADGLGDIRDATAFAQRRDAIARDMFGEAMRRLQQAETILSLVAEVRGRLDSKLIGWARGNLDDMQAQLAALVAPGFLRDVPATALADAALAGQGDEPGWQALRWELEELRVSLFAQELGAKGGVSAKKLAQRIALLGKPSA